MMVAMVIVFLFLIPQDIFAAEIHDPVDRFFAQNECTYIFLMDRSEDVVSRLVNSTYVHSPNILLEIPVV